MYRYYQKTDTSTWTPITDSDKVKQEALAAGAKKLTILAVSEVVNNDTERAELSYKGPFYMDIDHADLNVAIDSAKRLLQKLRDMSIPDEVIQIFASGGKGFHFIIDEKVFSSGRKSKDLPQIYKEMALDLFVTGMDMQVYSGGRGNCWRIENIQREKDGNYRVPITAKELMSLNSDTEYKELVSQPRHIALNGVNGTKAHSLELLMEQAKKRLKQKPKTISVVTEQKLKQFKDGPPACVQAAASYEVKPSAKFNEVCMQLAIFLNRAACPNTVVDSVVDRVAEFGHSTQYDSVKARKEHINGLVHYMKNNPKMNFSCNAMRSICSSNPCEECPLEEETKEETGSDQGDYQIFEKHNGYYAEREKSETQITNFTLRPIAVYIEKSQSGRNDRRIGTMVEMIRNETIIRTFMLNEEAWMSASALKREIAGIDHAAFFGTDLDVQRLKVHVLGSQEDIGEVMQVHSAGIHFQRVGGKDIKVYVEPGMSVNELRVKGTHNLVGRIQAPPRIRDYSLPKVGDTELTEILTAFMDINEDSVVAQILGWFSAAHLKAQFMYRYAQFPLLSVWGNAGSGKTMTNTLYSSISGCKYAMDESSVNLTQITPFAMKRFCSSTTTVPRLLDEYNKSKITKYKYDMIGEVLKASWNNQVMAQGTLTKSAADGKSSGAQVEETPITSPICVMSEQAPEMPALIQRSIQVMLKSTSRLGKTKQFDYAFQHRDDLMKVGRALVFHALTTSIEWIEMQMDKWELVVPEAITDRPRYSYKVALTGLDFFEKVCEDLQQPVLDRIEDLRLAFLHHLEAEAENISKKKARTEVDSIMEELGTMVALTKSAGESWITEGVHYAVDSKYQLYLDLPLVHVMYKRYVRTTKGTVVIDNGAQLLKLLQQEPYFVTDKAIVKEMNLNRTVVQLDMNLMMEKGLNVSLFA